MRVFLRYRLPEPFFRSPRNAVLFIGLAAGLSALLAATSGVFILRLTGDIPVEAAGTAWFIWFLSDITGSIVVTPFIITWALLKFSSGGERNRMLSAFQFATLALAGWAVFGGYGYFSIAEYPLGFVIVPALAWAAYSMGHREFVTSVLLGSGYAIFCTVQGYGPFASLGTTNSLLLLQLFILVITTTGMLVHNMATSHRHMVQSLQITQDVAIHSLASLAETRDMETGGHIMRTQTYVRLLAEQLKDHLRFRDYLTQRRIELLWKSAPLHDIGKVGVPDAILMKPGKVTPEEFNEIKKHTIYGRDALVNATNRLGQNSFLTIAEEIIFTHHEKWDGSGYPQGLKEEDIPVSGRLMALADVYDALISKRCYKDAFNHQQARDIIIQGRGKHFDPAVVDAFLRCEREFINTSEEYRDK